MNTRITHYVLILCFLLTSQFTSKCQATFKCDNAERLYFFRMGLNNTTTLSYITNYTGGGVPVITDMFTMPDRQHNGLGANPIDNYLYYMKGRELMRLDANGAATSICPNLGFSSVYGCFDSKGRYWSLNGRNLEAYDIGTCSRVKGPFPVNTTGGTLDIVYNPCDGYLYFGNKRADTNGVVDQTYAGINFFPSSTYGGIAVGADGNLYGVSNVRGGGGNLSKIDLTTLTTNSVAVFNPGPSGGRSDMASFVCGTPAEIEASFKNNIDSCSYTVVFSDSSEGEKLNYYWDFGDPLSGQMDTSTLQHPTHTFTGSGTYTVTLIVSTSGNICSIGTAANDTIKQVVNINSLPNAYYTASPNPTTILEPTVHFTNLSNNANSFYWHFGYNNDIDSTTYSPSYTYDQTGTFQTFLIAVNEFGCRDTFMLPVEILDFTTLFIPNTFTPNGDGINDVFQISGTFISTTDFKLNIFDRWGNLIFQTYNQNDGWNGKVNGHNEVAQIDTYVWQLEYIDLENNRKSKVGHVNLIK